jgi:hypothetical protein
MSENQVGKHCFVFNPRDNGGESLALETLFFDNGDDTRNIYTNHILTLMSYGNSASFTIGSFQITPEILRKLANELESAQNSLPKKVK